MQFTDEQYYAISQLEKWYRKYNHQVIDISGLAASGVYEAVEEFIDKMEFDPREIVYLSYDQKQVLEMASKRLHAYYLPSIIYKYTRVVDFDSLPVINQSSSALRYHWEKDVRKKIDERYKLMVVFDSSLMNKETINDLCSFGIPIILMRDPALIPSPDTYTFLREPNIKIDELNPVLLRDPVKYFAIKALKGDKIAPGAYDTVTVVPRKQLNLYNLKSSEMVLTLSDELMNSMNTTYRENVMKLKTTNTAVNERLIVMNDMYAHKLVNPDEKRLKIFLRKGMVCYVSKCNKHAAVTRYMPIELRPEFYGESFTDLYLDRYYLNNIDVESRQAIPDEIVQAKYAYALSASMARLSHWDKVTIVADMNDELSNRLLYNAITRCSRSLTLAI